MTTPPDEAETEAVALARIEAYRRRRPRLSDETVTLAHGAGGKASAALVESVFIEAFGAPDPAELADAAVLDVGTGRLAFTTDSYVVQPRRFPGGSIGDLAVNGTVNDLAVCGAVPRWLSAAFVIEEGLPVAELRQIAADMRAAADRAGVAVVTGDTKVVAKGAADGVFITTAGVGTIPAGRRLGAALVRPGDRLVLSGPIGQHGMAILLARGELDLEADVRSDTAPVTAWVEALYTAGLSPVWLRDATRGGLGTIATELAGATGCGVLLDEEAIPVPTPVRGACDLLGIDPLYVANEGCFLAVVRPDQAEAAVETLRAAGASQASLVGEIAASPAGLVAVRNAFGGARLVEALVGDPLPRIC